MGNDSATSRIPTSEPARLGKGGKPLVFGGDHRYPPFEYLDSRGRPRGYNIDLVEALARALNLEVEFRLGEWSEVLRGLEDGSIDALPGIFYTPERARKLLFSKPHSVHHYVGVTRHGEAPPPNSLADLAGKRIVLQRGDAMHSLLLESDVTAHLTLVEDQEAVLRALAAGDHDCGIVTRVSALHFLRQNGWENLRLGREPFASFDYCFAMLPERSELLGLIDEGLQVLKDSGEYRLIHDRWLGIYRERPPSLLIALRYSAMVLLPLALIALGAFLWSWSLRRKVAARTRDLQQSMELFELLVEAAPVGIILSDDGEHVIHFNKRFRELYGYDPSEVPDVHTWWDRAYPDPQIRQQAKLHWEATVARSLEDPSATYSTEFPVRCRDGRVRQTEFRLARAGEHFLILLSDVSERHRLEHHLRQSQKLEAIGSLASGVAHDFNNMLLVIIGNAELARSRVSEPSPIASHLDAILAAAERSSGITRQLLAFARKQPSHPRLLDLNQVVGHLMNQVLRHLLGEEIEIDWSPQPGLWKVRLDPSQADQILINLCVNARDALDGSGRLRLRTTNIIRPRLDPSQALPAPADAFVCLTVSDNGCGMDKGTLERIFEPFFTTKGPHEGTGLGLSTVHGIVHQNMGFIEVESEPGEGSTFMVFLPRGEEETVAAPHPEVGPAESQGETILLVEDEKAILQIIQASLGTMGYRVLAATHPEEAIRLASAHPNGIHLLIADVVLPGMTGRELAQSLRPSQASLKVLYMSGYSTQLIADRGILEDGVPFIQKPMGVADLARKVREVLDR